MRVPKTGDRYYPWLGVLEDVSNLSEKQAKVPDNISYYSEIATDLGYLLNIHSPSVIEGYDYRFEGTYYPSTDSIKINPDSYGNLLGISVLLHEYAHFLCRWLSPNRKVKFYCRDSLEKVEKWGENWEGGAHGYTFAKFYRLTIDTFRNLQELPPIEWDSLK